ncbi:MAG: DUF839 domain-containing protein, partial [Pseudomonas sp.]
TRMEITGPLRGTDHVKTKYSTAGTHCRGTNNNCGNGYTPWGTYLTCEENWPGIFVNKGTRPEDQRRIGVGTSSGQYKWETAAGDSTEVADEFARFDVTVKGASATDDYRNEASTYGYIVEIDPYNSSTLATKRTALGRIKHENAAFALTQDGRAVVYMGDDQADDYIYKFVSDGKYAKGGDNSRLLDSGKLYVA